MTDLELNWGAEAATNWGAEAATNNKGADARRDVRAPCSVATGGADQQS